MCVSVCVVCVCLFLTSEVIDLFFLQQTNSVIVSLQHELCLRVLGDHRLTPEILFFESLLLVFCTCLCLSEHVRICKKKTQNKTMQYLYVSKHY